ncbi:MAG: hypothetical protein KGD70_14915 [Candidatus Lokiarchaeota archaeon]|nr:hypothetical protein [Candidatus Bathyarchaeota archaeon]MBY9013660.1 hypothetical protein [Candidatus Lokiarchaeota archaeon]MCJ7713556.1 hypothetical protein [Candidatus Bathyarchaeota archaeon]
MITQPIDSLTKQILNRYNKQPVGWSILRDFKGNVLIIGPRDGYMLKIVTINPQEYTGVGAKIENPNDIRSLIKGAPLYGYRPLPKTQAKELLNSFNHTEKQNSLILKILKRKPVPAWELERKKPSLILSGPILAHPDLSTISKSQKELDLKLTNEAQKLFKQKYPNRAEMYR